MGYRSIRGSLFLEGPALWWRSAEWHPPNTRNQSPRSGSRAPQRLRIPSTFLLVTRPLARGKIRDGIAWCPPSSSATGRPGPALARHSPAWRDCFDASDPVEA